MLVGVLYGILFCIFLANIFWLGYLLGGDHPIIAMNIAGLVAIFVSIINKYLEE